MNLQQLLKYLVSRIIALQEFLSVVTISASFLCIHGFRTDAVL